MSKIVLYETDAVIAGEAGVHKLVARQNGIHAIDPEGDEVPLRPETPEYYGAVGGGIVDDTDAIKAFHAANDNPIYPNKIYRVSGNNVIVIRQDQVCEFQGTRFIHDTDSDVTISATNVNGWQVKGSVKVQGAGLAPGAAKAFLVVGCSDYRVANFSADDVSGWAVKREPGIYEAPRGNQGHWTSIQIKRAAIGYENSAGPGGEFDHICMLNISGCTKALRVAAGNTHVVSGNIVDNVDGVELLPGPNHAHGSLLGVKIAHNSGFSFKAENIEHGHTISGCHFYADSFETGRIILTGCTGIKICSGIISACIQSDDATGANFITDNFIDGAVAGLVGNDLSKLIVTNNFTADGYWDKNIHPAMLVAGCGSAQSIPVSSATQIVYDTADEDFRGMLDTNTGEITIKVDGVYGLDLNYYITGSNLTGGYFTIILKPAATGVDEEVGYVIGVIFNSFNLLASASRAIRLNAGDKIRVTGYVNGTSAAIYPAGTNLGITLRT